MYISKYVQCLVKVTNYPFTLMISDSLHLVYSLYSRVSLFLAFPPLEGQGGVSGVSGK